jgi:hypothetical protein
MVRALVLIMLTASTTLAGVYSPDTPTPFPVRADGTAEPLAFGPGFEGPFAVRLGTLTNEADERTARQRGAKNDDRAKLLARIDQLRQKGNRSLAETLALSADYLRANKAGDALNLLAPLSRSRTPDFRVLTNLAHAHAVRGEWDEATRWHTAALLDTEFPTELAGTTPEQRKWLRHVERDYYRKWLQIHRKRAVEKLSPEAEGVFPLFPARFINDTGQYEPGKLAAAERAKLPADAVAVVQQLLLWSPWDTSLYWLLAELYAAEGQLRAADTIFFQCANSRQYSNRPTLMAHRAAIREAVAKLPAEAPTDVPALGTGITPDAPTPARTETGDGKFLPSEGKTYAVGAVFALVALVLLALQVRALRRRRPFG